MDGWMVTAVQVHAPIQAGAYGRPATMAQILVIGLSIALPPQMVYLQTVTMLSTTATSMVLMVYQFTVTPASTPSVMVMILTARKIGRVAIISIYTGCLKKKWNY